MLCYVMFGGCISLKRFYILEKITSAHKPYNLTYSITFITVATFRDPFYAIKYTKPYKMYYIDDFIIYSAVI